MKQHGRQKQDVVRAINYFVRIKYSNKFNNRDVNLGVVTDYCNGITTIQKQNQ